MDILTAVQKAAAGTGFSEFGFVPMERLSFRAEVRRLCQENTCRNYGTSWACPPAVGTLEECRARIAGYDHMLLFSRAYTLEDSFDFEGMVRSLRDFKDLTDRFQLKLEPILPGFLLLSNEGCGRCEKCTYPQAPCRFPRLLHHALEGYGFVVSELAREANIRGHHGENTVTFFGALLFR